MKHFEIVGILSYVSNIEAENEEKALKKFKEEFDEYHGGKNLNPDIETIIETEVSRTVITPSDITIKWLPSSEV